MQKFPYYAITVRRYNVLFRHTDWLKKTQEALRILEILTIVGRDKQPVPTPLPWKKIPLYFRRAAINTDTGTPYREIYRIRYLLQGNVS